MNKTLRRTGAVLGAATLAGMATVAPSYAAETVAQSSANAVTIAIAGNADGSGTVTATHDGQTLQKDGSSHPAIGVLPGQDLLDVGTLAQDATAGLDGRDGVSAACAGVAGDGATLAQVGDGNCLTGGDNVGISMGNLDLTDADLINQNSAIGALSAIEPLMDQAIAPISKELSGALADVPVDLGGTAGVLEARCEASPGRASGNANLADAWLTATVDGTTHELVKLPINPPPNTKLVSELDQVVGAVLAAVEVQLTEGLDGMLVDGAALPAALQEQVVDTLVKEIATQLEPIEQNLLDVTLNKQTSSSAGQISVTALDIQVVPAAREYVDASLASVSLGNVTCGPNGRYSPDAPAAPAAPEAPAPGGAEPNLPAVPTVVDSGVGSDAASWEAALYAGGLVAAAGFAGLAGYRRFVVSS